MKNQFDHVSYLDGQLKRLDEDMIWGEHRRNDLEQKILTEINKVERFRKARAVFKYVSSIAAMIVVLLIGYPFLSMDVAEEGVSVGDGNQQPAGSVNGDQTAYDEADEEEKEVPIRFHRQQITRDELAQEIDLRLPSYFPVQAEDHPTTTIAFFPDGHVSADVLFYDSGAHYIRFSQEEIEEQEEAIEKVKEEMYPNGDVEELEVDGFPAFLVSENENSYYSSLHIITDAFFFTITTHGFEKNEIMKIADSIDFTGL